MSSVSLKETKNGNLMVNRSVLLHQDSPSSVKKSLCQYLCVKKCLCKKDFHSDQLGEKMDYGVQERLIVSLSATKCPAGGV